MPPSKESLQKCSWSPGFYREWSSRGGVSQRGSLAENFHFLVSPDNGLKHASEQMIKGVCDASWSERQQPLGDKILAFGEGHLWWIKETENPWISNWTGESVHYALVGGLVKMRRILSVLSRNCVILKTREEQSCCSSLSPKRWRILFSWAEVWISPVLCGELHFGIGWDSTDLQGKNNFLAIQAFLVLQ